MNLANQMNSISRLVIVIFIILFLFDFRYSILFLLISLIFIIILYYIQRNQMERFQTEHYNNTSSSKNRKNNGIFHSHVPNKHIDKSNGGCIKASLSSCRFCDNSQLLDGPNGINNPYYISPNQLLVGAPNPKRPLH